MSQDLTLSSDLSPEADRELNRLFRSARTHKNWTSEPVSIETLNSIYETMKYGPTSANSSPLRMVFIATPEAKERLLPAMAEGNLEKTRTAPVTVIFAIDSEFYTKFDRLFPMGNMEAFFAGNPEIAARSAFQGSSLQAAYFMIVARAHGLDCGPMGGFNADKVNEEFFPDGKWKVNFICNLGHGDPASLQPRLPRLEFDEVCKIL